MSNDYKYKGVELTPKIFTKLLIELFDGTQFKRAHAVEKVVETHLQRGGICNKSEYNSTFKKASSYLRNQGIKNVTQGTWTLNYHNNDIKIVHDNSSQNKKSRYKINKEIGIGKESIYIYYYKSYKDLALMQENDKWECKIGRTERNPLERVFNQAGTCYPELPTIALVINCDSSSLMEKAIHSILKIQNRWLKHAPGSEWFLTNPEEIEKIYNSILKNN